MSLFTRGMGSKRIHSLGYVLPWLRLTHLRNTSHYLCLFDTGLHMKSSKHTSLLVSTQLSMICLRNVAASMSDCALHSLAVSMV